MGLKITAGVQICKRAFIHFLVYLIYLLIYPFIYLSIYVKHLYQNLETLSNFVNHNKSESFPIYLHFIVLFTCFAHHKNCSTLFN